MDSTDKSSVIIIGEGSATALAGGLLSLAELGERTTKRASNLVHDPITDHWVVIDAESHEILFSDADYDVALRWEIDHFNQRLAAG